MYHSPRGMKEGASARFDSRNGEKEIIRLVVYHHRSHPRFWKPGREQCGATAQDFHSIEFSTWMYVVLHTL